MVSAWWGKGQGRERVRLRVNQKDGVVVRVSERGW